MVAFIDMDSSTSEAISTTPSEDGLKSISFEDLCYSVGDGYLGRVLRRKRKDILKGLSGSFNAGELTVIMGQSGAGKSTLMDILAGYTKPTSGTILVNNQVRDEKSFRRITSYILQDVNIWDMFTVQESLNFAAEFKLGNHFDIEKKRKRVQEVMTSLGLYKKQHTKACDLSGGQKKRLSIGLELISDSSIMFLDEPTSGLDSFTSKQIVYLLYLLARQGRAMVVTIHQPSAALLQMVDRLYIVDDGRCAYMGSVPNIIPYMETMELKCPTYHSPIDYFMDLCAEAADKQVLLENSKNGKNLRWITTRMSDPSNCQKADGIFGDKEYMRCISIEYNNLQNSSLPTPSEDSTSGLLKALKGTYPTSFLKQFSTLCRRHFLKTWRDQKFTWTIIGIHFAMAMLIGLLFFNIGVTAQDAMNNFKFLHFSALFLMFTAFSAVTISFPEQIPVARTEHFNRWYTSCAYYASTLVSSLVLQSVCSLTYGIFAYFLTGQPLEFSRIMWYNVMLLLISYVALSVGLFNGVVFDVQNGVVFGPLLIMPFIMFAGFLLLYIDAPFYTKWAFQMSFLKHGVTGLMLAIYGMDRSKMPCSATYCHHPNPRRFLKYLEMEHETFSSVIYPISITAAIIILLSFIILRIRLIGKW